MQPLYSAPLHRPLVKLSTPHYSSAFRGGTYFLLSFWSRHSISRDIISPSESGTRPEQDGGGSSSKKKKGRHIPGHPGDLRPQLCPCGDLARCHPDVGRGALAEMTKRLAAGRTLPRSNFHHRAHYTHTHTYTHFKNASTSCGKSVQPQAGGL